MQESVEYLANIGVPREKLHVTGVPIDPLFEKSVSAGDARKKLGLTPNEPVLLLSAGGYGVGPLELLVKDLLAMQRPWQIVAIAGKSEPLKKRLDTLSKSAGKNPTCPSRLGAAGLRTR